MNISLVIFCYNEASNLERLIGSCFEVCSLISSSYEIIVVDDGSRDETSDILKKLSAENAVLKIITLPVNRGIGIALRTGYAAASKEFICAIPGDGQFDVNELLEVKAFTKDSFYSFFRPETDYNPYRRFLSFSNKIFNQILLGIKLKDVNWIKVYRKDQIVYAELKMESSIVESEICAKLIKSGCRAIEIPSVYHKREGGVSKGGSWKTLSKVIRELWALTWIVHTFKPNFLSEN